MATRKRKAVRAAKRAHAELSNTSNTNIEENTDEAATAAAAAAAAVATGSAAVETVATAVGEGEGKNNLTEATKDEMGAAAPPKKSAPDRLFPDFDTSDDR